MTASPLSAAGAGPPLSAAGAGPPLSAAGAGTTASAADHLPKELTLPALREAAASCRGCPLWKPATQTVFGDGDPDADLMFVGEVPGNKEDEEGEPFVGPAGRLLDEGMEQAGIDRSSVYVTNVVKHFKFRQRGKRRIHQKPNRDEIDRCSPWLASEIEVVDPRLLVTLGATASQALLGSSFRVTRQRGEIHHLDDGRPVIATIHPSAVLRAGDDRHEMMEGFVRDLEVVARVAGERW